MVSQDEQTDESQDGVEDDERPADVIFVSNPTEDDHEYARSCVRRRNKALRGGNAESHVQAEDYGQKVCDGVGLGGYGEENEREPPNLQVETCAGPLPEVEWFGDGVTTVPVDPIDDEANLTLVQEMP